MIINHWSYDWIILVNKFKHEWPNEQLPDGVWWPNVGLIVYNRESTLKNLVFYNDIGQILLFWIYQYTTLSADSISLIISIYVAIPHHH